MKKLGHMNFHMSRQKFSPGKHARHLDLKQQQRNKNQAKKQSRGCLSRHTLSRKKLIL